MKFKFRLEKVLSFLKLQETMLKMEVSQLQRYLTVLLNQVSKLEEESKLLLEDTPRKLSENAAWAPYQTAQVGVNTKRIHELEVNVDRVENELSIKKLELGRHAMRRNALENLRVSKLQEFKVEERRRDQKKMDELFQLSNPKGNR